MQLVLIAHGRGAAFQVRDLGAVFTDHQRTLKLAGVSRVDAEVSRQLHRALDAFRYEDERAIGEHGRVQRSEIVIRYRHHGTQVLLNEIRVIANSLGNGAENHARFRQLFFEGRRNRDGVEYRIDGNPCQGGTLVQRNTQFFVGFQQLGVDFIQALGAIFWALGRTKIGDLLVIDGRIVQVCPGRLFHLQPLTVSVQAPLQHPLRLAFLLGDEGDGVFIQARWQCVAFNIGYKAIFVLATNQLFHFFACHGDTLRAVGWRG